MFHLQYSGGFYAGPGHISGDGDDIITELNAWVTVNGIKLVFLEGQSSNSFFEGAFLVNLCWHSQNKYEGMSICNLHYTESNEQKKAWSCKPSFIAMCVQTVRSNCVFCRVQVEITFTWL